MTNAPDNCFMAPHHHLMERCGHCTYEWDPPVPPESGEPLLTASEVKVLTETASKVAYALGRKDAGEEIAAALKRFREDVRGAGRRGWPLLTEAWVISLETALQAAGATSDATSGVPGHREVSEAARSPQERCPCAEGNTP